MARKIQRNHSEISLEQTKMIIPNVPAQPDSVDEYDWQTLRAARCRKRRRQAGFSQDGDVRAVLHGTKSFKKRQYRANLRT